MKLKRIAFSEHGTFGVLIDNGVPFCLTLERPWLNNKKGESCIPAGLYTCKRTISPRFGETFEVAKVLGRSHILIHKGNIAEDSHGCIILGEQYEKLGGRPAVLSSSKAFKEFMGKSSGVDEFELLIVDLGK